MSNSTRRYTTATFGAAAATGSQPGEAAATLADLSAAAKRHGAVPVLPGPPYTPVRTAGVRGVLTLGARMLLLVARESTSLAPRGGAEIDPRGAPRPSAVAAFYGLATAKRVDV